MDPSDIRQHLRRQPFRPFRMFMTDGSFYDVLHPDFALLTLTELVVALEPTHGEIPERKVFCDPAHITRIKPLTGRKAKGSSRGPMGR